jgi:hypothetical protein
MLRKAPEGADDAKVEFKTNVKINEEKESNLQR